MVESHNRVLVSDCRIRPHSQKAERSHRRKAPNLRGCHHLENDQTFSDSVFRVQDAHPLQTSSLVPGCVCYGVCRMLLPRRDGRTWSRALQRRRRSIPLLSRGRYLSYQRSLFFLRSRFYLETRLHRQGLEQHSVSKYMHR